MTVLKNCLAIALFIAISLCLVIAFVTGPLRQVIAIEGIIGLEAIVIIGVLALIIDLKMHPAKVKELHVNAHHDESPLYGQKYKIEEYCEQQGVALTVRVVQAYLGHVYSTRVEMDLERGQFSLFIRGQWTTYMTPMWVVCLDS